MLGFAVGRWVVGSLCGNYHKNYHTKSKIKCITEYPLCGYFQSSGKPEKTAKKIPPRRDLVEVRLAKVFCHVGHIVIPWRYS